MVFKNQSKNPKTFRNFWEDDRQAGGVLGLIQKSPGGILGFPVLRALLQVGYQWSPFAQNLHFRIRFLAMFGPFWAHNRPSRGCGWPRLILLIVSAATIVHFDAKNLQFFAFSEVFSNIFLRYSPNHRQSPHTLARRGPCSHAQSPPRSPW